MCTCVRACMRACVRACVCRMVVGAVQWRWGLMGPCSGGGWQGLCGGGAGYVAAVTVVKAVLQ